MDFQKLLLEVGKALSNDEVKALAFLCTELLGRHPSSVELASDLFTLLADQDHLSAERPELLTELLNIIQRTRLVRDLKLTEVYMTKGRISPFRRLLYKLSEELTDSDLKMMKFLLNKKLPRRKLEENITTLEVFQEMEHMDLLSKSDMKLLESIIQPICPVLTEDIHHYEAQYLPPTSRVTQEMGQLSLETRPLNTTQESYERSFSNVNSVFDVPTESTSGSLNITCNLPNMYNGGDECEALSRDLNELSTQTRTAVTGDALVKGPQHEEDSKSLMSLAAHTNTILGTYPMAAEKRGICLIINNYKFPKTHLQKREGTSVDEENLHKVFKWLGFDIETQRDCNTEKMLTIMHELASRNHSHFESLVCCILSHGQEGSVYGVEGRTVTYRELMEPFSGINCSSLAEKPKLFFIQACQGNREQRAVTIEADGPAGSLVQSDAVVAKDSIPSDADFLLGMATVASFISYRERTKGTWFIQSLCENLIHMVPSRCNLVSILTKVNADVSRRTDSYGVKKQMPQLASTLTKKVIFPIPRDHPPSL